MPRRATAKSRLSAMPMLSGVSPLALERIERMSTVLSVPSDRVLMNQGAFGQEFAMILSGSVEVTIDGERRAELGPGDIVGEVAMAADVRRTATVRTTTDVELAVVPRHQFEQFLREAPAASRRLLGLVASRLLEMSPRTANGDASDSPGCHSPGR